MSLKEYSSKLSILFSFLKDNQQENSINELMELRAYVKEEQRNFFSEIGIFKTKSSDEIITLLAEKNLLNSAKELKLVNENNYFILEERFLVPIRNVNNKLISIVGWAREWHDTKYITIPSPYLDLNIDWFGLPYAIKIYTDYIVVVEGIFDCLSLNSLGIPTIAMMGAKFPYSKSFILQAFDKVIFIPDNDVIGKSSLKNWKYVKGTNTTFIDLRGTLTLSEDSEPIFIKDTDNLASYIDTDTLLNLFEEISKSTRLSILLNVSSENDIVF